MKHHNYTVERSGEGWAVLHRGKVLETHAAREEAEAHADRLARLTQASGHDAEVLIQDESGDVASDEVYRRLT
jgi:hypothetical protein